MMIGTICLISYLLLIWFFLEIEFIFNFHHFNFWDIEILFYNFLYSKNRMEYFIIIFFLHSQELNGISSTFFCIDSLFKQILNFLFKQISFLRFNSTESRSNSWNRLFFLFSCCSIQIII